MTPTQSLGWLLSSNYIYNIIYYIYSLAYKYVGALIGCVCFLLNNTFNLFAWVRGRVSGEFRKIS